MAFALFELPVAALSAFVFVVRVAFAWLRAARAASIFAWFFVFFAAVRAVFAAVTAFLAAVTSFDAAAREVVRDDDVFRDAATIARRRCSSLFSAWYVFSAAS
ncbi:hypothetical protein QP157_06705 [Sphingomonas sp. LR61]|uniref:hypothetical protein n=1 Tax=Sphingomonas sp. LR61 TaxID=3050234 RepID=UPI002FE1FB2E